MKTVDNSIKFELRTIEMILISIYTYMFILILICFPINGKCQRELTSVATDLIVRETIVWVLFFVWIKGKMFPKHVSERAFFVKERKERR